jgi:CRISPR/Cas system endoribonuclease Cas6 (RAMP superfamily)
LKNKKRRATEKAEKYKYHLCALRASALKNKKRRAAEKAEKDHEPSVFNFFFNKDPITSGSDKP